MQAKSQAGGMPLKRITGVRLDFSRSENTGTNVYFYALLCTKTRNELQRR